MEEKLSLSEDNVFSIWRWIHARTKSLYIYYINDLMTEGNLELYAHDTTTLYIIGNNVVTSEFDWFILHYINV